MKEIKITMLHPACCDIGSTIRYLQIEDLQKDFDFVWDETSPDYVIASEHVFTNRRINYKFKQLSKKTNVRIFHGGEAVSPDFNIFDYAVGFDAKLDYLDRFSQLPPPDVFFEGFVKNKSNQVKSVEEAKKVLSQKTGFCNFLYSNRNANPRRDEIFYALSNYKKVDSLGRWLNNVGKLGTGYVGHASDCIAIKNPYKFSIASENARYFGYISEKILTSLEAHTVPIYWGDPLIEESINPKAFINCNSINDLDELIERVKRIDEDDELWCEMVSQPWQNKEQELLWRERNEKYLNFFRHIFNQPLSEALRRPDGTWNYNYHSSFWDNITPKTKKMNIIDKIYKRIKS